MQYSHSHLRAAKPAPPRPKKPPVFCVGWRAFVNWPQPASRIARLSPAFCATVRPGASMVPLAEAVVRAGRTRLRPILMTSLTTIVGLIPMALGILVGSEANAPLARAVIGGLTVSTVLTLVLVPTFYTILEERFPRVLPAEDATAS